VDAVLAVKVTVARVLAAAHLVAVATRIVVRVLIVLPVNSQVPVAKAIVARVPVVPEVRGVVVAMIVIAVASAKNAESQCCRCRTC
jgi:hypothetical protein